MNIIYFLNLKPNNESLDSEKNKLFRLNRRKFFFEAARKIVKKSASEILGIEQNLLEFETSGNGKPFIKNISGFHFNISHCENALAVAISDGEIGIDCEEIREVNPLVAQKKFARNEKCYLNEKSGDFNKRFFEIWTKKEAFLKRNGKGITLPLNSFDVTENPLKDEIFTIEKNGFIISVCSEHHLKDFVFKEIKQEDI